MMEEMVKIYIDEEKRMKVERRERIRSNTVDRDRLEAEVTEVRLSRMFRE